MKIRGMGFGAIRGDETRNHDGEIEQPDNVLECGDESNVTVDGEDAAIGDAT